jgi:hypothetical protein
MNRSDESQQLRRPEDKAERRVTLLPRNVIARQLAIA